jgi:hypothetical protein
MLYMFCSFCGEKNSDNFRFCSSCGKQRSSIESDIQNKSPNQVQNLSDFKEIANTIHVFFSGNEGSSLGQVIANSLQLKNTSKILFNLYVSENYFVVLPVSKDKGGMVLWGLLLGGGALAGAAVGALEALSKKLELKDAKAVSEQDDALKNALIFPKSNIRLQVKETRANTGSLSDLYKKETWFLITGTGLYNLREWNVAVEFGFSGQVSNPNKPMLSTFDIICSTLKIDKPTVHTGKNAPF